MSPPSDQRSCQAVSEDLAKLTAKLIHSMLIGVTGFLRRSFSQSVEVRTCLYLGLTEVLQSSPALKETVCELLLPQVSSCHLQLL